MKSIFLMLFQPTKGFEMIRNEFSYKLKRQSLFIFAIYGITTYFLTFTLSQSKYPPFFIIIGVFISCLVSIAVMKLYSFIIFLISHYLGAKTEDVDIEAVFAHAIFPMIIAYIAIIILKGTELSMYSWNSVYLWKYTIIVSIFLFLKLLLQGLRILNNFPITKNLIIISPIILIYLGLFAYNLF